MMQPDGWPVVPNEALILDKEMVSQAETIGDVAMDFRKKLMALHPGKWKQFACQVFCDSVAGYVRLVYGIKEA